MLYGQIKLGSDFFEFVDEHPYAVKSGLRGLLSGGVVGALEANRTKGSYLKNILGYGAAGAGLGGTIGTGIDYLAQRNEPEQVIPPQQSDEDAFLEEIQQRANKNYINGFAKPRIYTKEDLTGDPNIAKVYEHWLKQK